MLTLCGFALSNYYNKVKFALLEKQVPFAEKAVPVSQDAEMLARSPLGKVPYLETPHGPLSESQVIVDYIEVAYPQTPLTARDPFLAAKQRELIVYLELHLELVARELYGEVFFGGPRTAEPIRERVAKQLNRNVLALKQLARFSPYIAGDTFSIADCAAFVHLPLIASASKAAFGSDALTDAGIDWRDYVKRIGERPAAQRVSADRKAYLDERARKG